MSREPKPPKTFEEFIIRYPKLGSAWEQIAEAGADGPLDEKTQPGRYLTLAQSWLYFVGVLVFARGMISGGLEGMPRRTFMAGATYSKPSWELAGTLTAIGGTLMFVSVILFLVVMFATIVSGRRREPGDIPFTETVVGPAASGWELRLDRFRIWVVVTILLILIAYAPFLVSYLPPKLWSSGFTIY